MQFGFNMWVIVVSFVVVTEDYFHSPVNMLRNPWSHEEFYIEIAVCNLFLWDGKIPLPMYNPCLTSPVRDVRQHAGQPVDEPTANSAITRKSSLETAIARHTQLFVSLHGNEKSPPTHKNQSGSLCVTTGIESYSADNALRRSPRTARTILRKFANSFFALSRKYWKYTPWVTNRNQQDVGISDDFIGESHPIGQIILNTKFQSRELMIEPWWHPLLISLLYFANFRLTTILRLSKKKKNRYPTQVGSWQDWRPPKAMERILSFRQRHIHCKFLNNQ